MDHRSMPDYRALAVAGRLILGCVSFEHGYLLVRDTGSETFPATSCPRTKADLYDTLRRRVKI
jgi:hypothetical protein